jgi:Kef-type K+ transport system membrane component KefB
MGEVGQLAGTAAADPGPGGGPGDVDNARAAISRPDHGAHRRCVSTFVHWLGLLLMFVSGTEMQQLFGRGERRTVGWLIIVGTGTPFLLGLLFGPHPTSPSLAGQHANRLSLIIILAVGVAVTSVPVVSKIFADLRILDTLFARLALGVAVLEDIVLWLALAVATALAAKMALNPWQMSLNLCLTVVYFVVGSRSRHG